MTNSGNIEIEDISIHAPRTGSDILFEMDGVKYYISIHAPRTGSDENACTD